jgi:hypothetical protein
MASVEVSQGSVEALRRVLSYLVGERQHLRANGAPRVELEANRKAIVAMQMQLARALGRRFGSADQEPAATFRSTEGSRPLSGSTERNGSSTP